MNNYLVILSDMEGVPDFLHPSQIYGKDKLDVQNVIQQDTPPEYIKGIYTPQEYLQFVQSDKFKNLLISFNPMLGKNKNALQNFIGNLINYIKDIIGSTPEEQNNIQIPSDLISQEPKPELLSTILPEQSKQIEQSNINIQQPPQISQKKEVKYFNDNGIQFKLENGELYKKIWEDVKLEITTDQNGNQIYPEIRLINIETGKPTKSSKIGVQKLVWKKLD